LQRKTAIEQLLRMSKGREFKIVGAATEKLLEPNMCGHEAQTTDVSLLKQLSPSIWGFTCHIKSHGVTCHPTQVNSPLLNPASQAGTRFTYPGGMEGWVDLGGWLHTKMVYLSAVVSNRSSNRARCVATSLIETNVLSTMHRAATQKQQRKRIKAVAKGMDGQNKRTTYAVHLGLHHVIHELTKINRNWSYFKTNRPTAMAQ